MQWATFHGMPFAIGISKGFPQYASMSANARTLFHCWLPDATHVQIDPSLLHFPRHQASEWAENYYRTSDAQSSIVKFVSRDLRSRAPNVVKFLESFEFELTEMQDLLTQVVLGASITEVACEWARSKRSVWQRWVPIET
ncbi:ENDOV, partial [Symbiodinium sp. CCMP2456]